MAKQKIGQFMFAERKREGWNIRNARHKDLLGRVVWSSSWQKYVFVPASLTEFSSGCLIDLATFLDQAHKEEDDDAECD